jgi:hypothetical protein
LRVPPESTGDTFPLGRVAENAATSEDDSGDDERAPPAQLALVTCLPRKSASVRDAYDIP